MIVRRLRREELMDAERIRSIAFHYPVDEEDAAKRMESVSEEWLRQSWGCFDEDGTLMACIINNDFSVRFDGQIVKMGGIGGVATLPEYRYGGAVKATLAEILRTARAEGEIISSLYPFSHEFYRKAGYEQFLPLKEYHFQPGLVRGYKHTGWTKRIGPEGDLSGMKAVYAEFAKNYNMMFEREDDRYRRGNPFKDGQFTMLLGDERGARAYLYYRTDKEDGKNVLNVRDIAFADAEGFRMCLGYLGRMSADYALIRMMLPEDIPLRYMIPTPYDMTISTREQPMARLTNAEKALALMKKPEGAVFTVKVEDDFLPENSGCYQVSGEGVVRTEGAADIEVSSRALTLLTLGSMNLERAAYRTDVKINANRETLERVFVRKPLFMADYF